MYDIHIIAWSFCWRKPELLVRARVRGGLAMCIVAFSGCGAGAPRIFFWGYDSVEPIFCHYADVSRLGT